MHADDRKLPIEVPYQPAWLTWVASTTTCLKALGVDCDQTDVAGFSGYAFHVCIHETLCPSAPTALDWPQLSRGAHALGRATLEFRAPDFEPSGSHRDECARAAFEIVKRELRAGRPCVLWGTYLPEFGVVVGTRGDAYLVKSFKEVLDEAQPPIPYNRTEPCGGIYVLGFPAAISVASPHAGLFRDLETILLAIRFWTRPPHGPYRYGADAYDAWITALQAGRADRFGCGYNAACYAEGRRFAQQFFERMSTRRPLAADLLHQAAASYRLATEATAQVSNVFPFTHEVQGPITDKARSVQAVALLTQARAAENQAIAHLAEVTRIDASCPT
jgi:hypothetical protein